MWAYRRAAVSCQVSLQMCSEQIAFATGLLFWNGETRQRDAINEILFGFVLRLSTPKRLK